MTACHCATFQKDHGADKVLQMTIMLLVLTYQVSLQKDLTLKIFGTSVSCETLHFPCTLWYRSISFQQTLPRLCIGPSLQSISPSWLQE